MFVRGCIYQFFFHEDLVPTADAWDQLMIKDGVFCQFFHPADPESNPKVMG